MSECLECYGTGQVITIRPSRNPNYLIPEQAYHYETCPYCDGSGGASVYCYSAEADSEQELN